MSGRRDRSSRGQPLRVAAVGADSAIHREVVRSLAAAESAWRVDAYSNGADALKAIPGSPPHVVLMDIDMPGISGVECTRRLRARLPPLPVVIPRGGRHLAAASAGLDCF